MTKTEKTQKYCQHSALKLSLDYLFKVNFHLFDLLLEIYIILVVFKFNIMAIIIFIIAIVVIAKCFINLANYFII